MAFCLIELRSYKNVAGEQEAVERLVRKLRLSLLFIRAPLGFMPAPPAKHRTNNYIRQVFNQTWL